MLKIDKEKCTACGVCEATCAFGAIAVKGECAEVNESCTLCGACVDNCPEAALHIEIVDKRAQATPLRVEKLARSQLKMFDNSPARTHYVALSESGKVLSSSPAKVQEVAP